MMAVSLSCSAVAATCLRPTRPAHAAPLRCHEPTFQPYTHGRSSSTACQSTAAGASAAAVVVDPPNVRDAPPPVTGDLPEAARDAWQSFAQAVSGEWEGVTASFDPAGEPIPLPEYYVPEAYRDWGVELFDWQSQSSMLASEAGVQSTHRRMIPTVGCEADAIAFTQESTHMLRPEEGFATVAPDGGYSHHSPADTSGPGCHKAAAEQCLVLSPGQRRLRVVHSLRRRASDGAWLLDSVELHSERYDSPYRGKLELSGCGGGMRGFAADARLERRQLEGSWRARGLRYRPAEDGRGCCCESVTDAPWLLADVAGHLLLHPLSCWTAADISGEDITLVAGVLLDESAASMAVVCRRLVSGCLHSAELLTLTRA